jgi:formylglycine-generating enzyme required for sulfatase activity
MTRGLPAVSRADLLRALSLVEGDSAAGARFADLLHFVARPPPVPAFEMAAALAQPPALQPAPASSQPPGEPAAAPLRPPLQVALAGVTDLQPIADARDPNEGAAAPSALPPDPRPRAPGWPLLAPPLVRASQLWPSLRGSLTVARAAGIDLPQLTRELAQARPLRQLPRQWRSLWGGDLWVIADGGDRMRPYARDAALVVRQLVRLRGRGRLRVWRVDGRPDRPLGAGAGGVQAERTEGIAAWPLPPPDTVVLILSDAGSLARDPGAEAAWLALARRFAAGRCHTVCWAPLAPSQLGRAFASLVAVHCLRPGAALKRQPGRWVTPTQREAERRRLDDLLDELRTRVACCLDLDVELLRCLRLTHPALRAEPALEGLYWTDQPRVGEGMRSRPLAPDVAAAARARLKSLPADERIAILGAIMAHHAAHARSTEAIECSIWRTHAHLAAGEWPAAVQAQLGSSQRWLQALSDHLASPAADDPAAALYAADLLGRQGSDLAWQQAESDVVATLWALSELEQAPSGVDDRHLVRARRRRLRREPQQWQLVQRGDALWLWPAEAELPERASPFQAGGRAAEPVLRTRDAAPRRRPGTAAQPLFRLDAAHLPATLSFDDASITIDIVPRPRWALEWGRDATGLYALAPTPWGEPARLDWRLGATGASFTPLAQKPSRLPLSIGFDSVFGIHADLELQTGRQRATQRFRWLPPGDFWMGSTDAERARLRDKQWEEWARDESPRHRVRLTHGFWLADTACTQELWLAVMGGKNPCHFTGDPMLPVEQVSFDDVQVFLQRLQPLLPPGCVAALPTESEWEYACRAGTDSAFSFGDHITPELVNVGDYPIDDATKGESRQRTVPVASLPPNAWGLYEMHGNVWEWCDDGLRRYDEATEAEPAIDPAGPRESGPEAHRAVRGGSWLNYAGDARSALRNADRRDDRARHLGFRLALRSTSPVAPEGPASQGLSGPGPEAPGAPARRDDGPARRWPDRLRDLMGGGQSRQPKPPATSKPKPRR